MQLYWQGTDITEHVNITGCVHRDVSGGRCDSLELTLDHASVWYRWGPQEDDEILVTHNGYSTGRLYLNAVIPLGDQYRVLATSTRRAAARKAWGSFSETTLKRIFDVCAAECQMEGKLYGIDGNLAYPYALRRREGAAAFLTRIGKWEGLCVKAYDGAFLGISVDFAQEIEPAISLEITSAQEGVTYRRRDNVKYTSLTVMTPYAQAVARDAGASGSNAEVFTHLPAMNNAQAGRWARGLLLMHNRRAEDLTIEQTLDTSLSALTRVDVTGGTDMTGEWIADEVEHDFVNARTTAKLLRVVRTIQ